ncbi:PilZ domain-containing protein [Neptunicella marina]|uniref:PilZ domain-containing protein n=1 Tax=Neptunicella marina TaxID=2125989 RepID=A0A8J6M6T0_9ALTE|nr:PilZ domain-containing protein [Neptunicella marina]MBC3767331.1 PilZ domain-containing protein [Neptunicella marina]
MLGYDDKRNFFRMMVNSGCELTVVDEQSSRTVSAVCHDISATGMSFEVDEPIEVGTRVQVSIESTSSQIPSLNADSKVVRCSEQGESNYMVGVEITEMK